MTRSGQGTEVPHAVEQLSLHVTARESMCCKEDPACCN